MGTEELISEIRRLCDDSGLKIGRIEIVGSSRRGKEDPRDLDILLEMLHSDRVDVSPGWLSKASTYGQVVDTFQILIQQLHEVVVVSKVDARTSKMGVHFVQDGKKVDLFLGTYDTWGAAMLYWTGSRHMNVVTRIACSKLHVSWDWFVVVDQDEGTFLPFSEEIDLLNFIGLDEAISDPRTRGDPHVVISILRSTCKG